MFGMGGSVSEDGHLVRFLRRHPWLELAFVLTLLGGYLSIFGWMMYYPPEFSAIVSSFEGLDRSLGAAAAPTFHVALRVKNGNVWQYCFKPGSAVVAHAGVPLARADFPKFCVPGRSVVKVPVVLTGEGLGLPDELYERVDSRRRRQERVPLAVRVRLDEDHAVPHNRNRPMLLWCTAMLDGRPINGPSRCPLFRMLEQGLDDLPTLYSPI